MVLVILGDSYGELHKAFFLCMGISSSIFWATLFSKTSSSRRLNAHGSFPEFQTEVSDDVDRTTDASRDVLQTAQEVCILRNADQTAAGDVHGLHDRIFLPHDIEQRSPHRQITSGIPYGGRHHQYLRADTLGKVE